MMYCLHTIIGYMVNFYCYPIKMSNRFCMHMCVGVGACVFVIVILFLHI